MTDIREEIRNRLTEKGEESYGDFSSRLAPGIERDRFIGVRMPQIRLLAKEMYRRDDRDIFLRDLPHRYYEENMLHSSMLCLEKDYDRALIFTEEFLPYIDNWAASDCLHPKAFEKNRDKLLPVLNRWIASDRIYTARVGIDTLMSLYLDEPWYDPSYLQWPLNAGNDDYYVRMMQAWFYAEALAKQWDSAFSYITGERLPLWIHNKTIQKAVESRRISDERKEILKGYRRRK